MTIALSDARIGHGPVSTASELLLRVVATLEVA
jgi:hypothetical protein